MLRRRLQVLKDRAGAAGSLVSFVYAASGVGRLYLDPLSWFAQILQYAQVNVRSLAPKKAIQSAPPAAPQK